MLPQAKLIILCCTPCQTDQAVPKNKAKLQMQSKFKSFKAKCWGQLKKKARTLYLFSKTKKIREVQQSLKELMTTQDMSSAKPIQLWTLGGRLETGWFLRHRIEVSLSLCFVPPFLHISLTPISRVKFIRWQMEITKLLSKFNMKILISSIYFEKEISLS